MVYKFRSMIWISLSYASGVTIIVARGCRVFQGENTKQCWSVGGVNVLLPMPVQSRHKPE